MKLTARTLRAFLPPAIPSMAFGGYLLLIAFLGLFDSTNPHPLQLATILVGGAVFWAMCWFAFFLPTTVAAWRGKANYNAILILNLFGFLIVPWIIAIVWAFAQDITKGPDSAAKP